MSNKSAHAYTSEANTFLVGNRHLWSDVSQPGLGSDFVAWRSAREEVAWQCNFHGPKTVAFTSLYDKRQSNYVGTTAAAGLAGWIQNIAPLSLLDCEWVCSSTYGLKKSMNNSSSRDGFNSRHSLQLPELWPSPHRPHSGHSGHVCRNLELSPHSGFRKPRISQVEIT